MGKVRVDSRRYFLVFILVAVSGIGIVPSSARAQTPCEGRKVVDYGAPFEKLPRLRRVPPTERLPFAPPRVWLGSLGGGLTSGASTLGFRLSYDTPHPVTLDWTLAARLRRVSPASPAGHLVATRHVRIADAKGSGARRLAFSVSAKPAIYAAEVSIFDGERRIIGRYGEYLRVLPFAPAAELRILGGPFHPGEWVTGCLENRGTVPLEPESTTIEREDASGWHPVAIGPQYHVAVPFTLRYLEPGEAGVVSSYLPPDAVAGSYRLAWDGTVQRARGQQSGAGRRRFELTTGFSLP